MRNINLLNTKAHQVIGDSSKFGCLQIVGVFTFILVPSITGSVNDYVTLFALFSLVPKLLEDA